MSRGEFLGLETDFEGIPREGEMCVPLWGSKMYILVDSVGGREGRWGYIDGRFQRETLADMSLKEVEGGYSLNY